MSINLSYMNSKISKDALITYLTARRSSISSTNFFVGKLKPETLSEFPPLAHYKASTKR